MQQDARDGWRSSLNGQRENANARQEDSVQRKNCPTQAKTSLEWATHRASLHLCEAAPELGPDLFGATLTLGSIEWSSVLIVAGEGSREFCFSRLAR
jgi:hypothetical protein